MGLTHSLSHSPSYIENWIGHKNVLIQNDSTLSDDEKQTSISQLIESVIVHIRFAMMTPTELSKLLLQPIIKLHAKFWVERISIGMSYHSEHQEDQVASIRATEAGALQFTPRLYTSDMYGLSMKLTNFESIENYQTFAACFFSQSNLSEYQEGKRMDFFFSYFQF